MTSKEEPNPSILFGDSAGDDPFSQILQQNSVPEVPSKEVIEEKQTPTANDKKAVGDASSLFGSGGGDADLFFSTTQPQPTSNASAASFFEQQSSESFFDGLGAGQSTKAHASTASLTQAFDPNTSEYQQPTTTTETYDQQQVEYDPNQWIQFDPNVHYYYDDQNQVHYYDPNTNQEYDMSQYTYDEQGQPYDYQYDPQYAEYYAQQGYDPATNTDPTAVAAAYPVSTDPVQVSETVPEQTYTQDNYDPNAYAPVPEQSYDQNFYGSQAYEPVNTNNNAIAEVPAQIQSEHTIGTQQQYAQDGYEYQQNYAPTDIAIQQDYETTDLQYVPTQEYSQTDFFAEDLQQAPAQAVPPPPKAAVLPPPPKEVITPPPPTKTVTLPSPPPKTTASAAPVDSAMGPISAPSSPKGSYNEIISLQEIHNDEPEKEVDLNDLDHMVLGSFGKDNHEQDAEDELDRLVSGSDLNYKNDTAPVYNNPNEYEETAASVTLTSEHTEEQVEKNDGQAFSSYEPQQEAGSYDANELQHYDNLNTGYSYEPYQQTDLYEAHQETTIDSQEIKTESYERHQETNIDSKETTFSSYEPYSETKTDSYEPHQDNAYSYEPEEQTVSFSAYEPQQDYSLKPEDDKQQAEQTFNYSSYAPQQETNAPLDQVVDYSSYLPQQDSNAHVPKQETNTYAPQQETSTYAPQQETSAYAPQPSDQVVDYSSYAPQQDNNAYAPQPSDQVVDYSSYAPQQSLYAPQQIDQTAGLYAPSQAVTEKPKDRSMDHHAPKQAETQAILEKQSVTSPPPRNQMISPPPANAMQTFTQQRSNSITEPDRKQNGSPFTGYYNQYHIERSATVPPPMTERIASPRPILTACPDPQCEGENKAKAKFCCECGRPLAGISRSTTPSASLSPGIFSMSEASSQPIRTALDDKKDVMRESLKRFNKYSVLAHDDEDKQKFALEYIESRIGEFKDDKALLWNIVKAMIQHDDQVLGDGGQLDKLIAALLVTPTVTNESSHVLDRLESFLAQGDREGACQFAAENDMWPHALVISQSHNPEHFKRVMSQFIDRELFSSSTELSPQLPGDKKELRMLYSVFSGAGADAVGQLTRNSLEDQPANYTKETLHDWKKPLSLLLVNRSFNDVQAITELGDQLKRVGSMIDASICYMLSPDTFSGLESSIIRAEGTDIYTDLDALYLTELYEYATKLNLRQYKLIHAWWLTEFGLTDEAKVYSDALTDKTTLEELQRLKQIGDTDSEIVTSLLKKATFDTLISAMSVRISSNHQNPTNPGTSSFGYDSNGPAYEGPADTLQQADSYNYGYSYGGGYTEAADNNGYPPLAQANNGIQSPFQNTQSSPFQSGVSSPFNSGVRSPFQHGSGYTQPIGTETTVEQPGYQPYQHETPAVTSYQPDAYEPVNSAPATTTATHAWDDDDDLGFGNTKKVTKEPKDEVTEGNAAREEKPNEVSVEEKKEEKAGGWGIFSLFGRKEKEQPAEEKKAVKANLGEASSFYYDEKEKRWVNKLNDAKPETTATPPPPKASTPQPGPSMAMAPPMGSPAPPMGSPAPPMSGLKPASMPPARISSTPNVPTTGGPPSAAPPSFNTPPASRRTGGARKSMRSRYVDVLNTN